MGMGRVMILAVVVWLGACAQSSSLVCGDGRTCPGNSTCDDLHHICVSPSQRAACDGLQNGETCTFEGQVGLCDEGVCIGASCGNTVVDADEACDDGNRDDGDGCRGDCKKIEMCGDGVVDSGEACDDSNTNSADGCDACVRTEWAVSVTIGTQAADELKLYQPQQMALDRLGNLYIADALNHRIRRIEPSGAALTIAGTGVSGFAGDGGLATSALMSRPSALVVDGLGNVYFADSGNYRVRRIDTDGIISTIAGTGLPLQSGETGAPQPALLANVTSPRGIAIDGFGNLYISEVNYVRKIDTTGTISMYAGLFTINQGYSGDGGAATSAAMNSPQGLAIYGGELYIADGNQCVRKVSSSGTITRVAGTCQSPGYGGDGQVATAPGVQFGNPYSIAFDDAGNMFVSESFNNTVRRIDATTKIITTVAGVGGQAGYSGDGGPATAAKLYEPRGLAVTSDGATLYIADSSNDRVRRVQGGTINAFAGRGGSPGDGGFATTAPLIPTDVAADGMGNIYIAEHDRIRKVAPSGIVTTVAGGGSQYGENIPATSAQLALIGAIAIDPSGNIYFADFTRVRKVDSTGMLTTYAGGAYGNSGNGGLATSAAMRQPMGLAFDGAGNLYLSDTTNHTIRRVDAQTKIITHVAGSTAAGFSGDGVAGGAPTAALDSPKGLVVAPNGDIYVADHGNHRVRRIAGTTISTVVGSSTVGNSGDGGSPTAAALSGPTGVALGANGEIYVTDTRFCVSSTPDACLDLRQSNNVRRVANNVITTVAGTGPGSIAPANRGDGGPASNARLAGPTGLVRVGTDLYIVDTGNRRVRKVDAQGTITTFAGSVDPEGIGPTATGQLADPVAFVRTPAFSLIGGGTGVVEMIRSNPSVIESVIGRYPQEVDTTNLARFRAADFGNVGGLAYDSASSTIYLSETTRHRIHAVSLVDPANSRTWTIATLANTSSTEGFQDGAASTARFRSPTGLYLDESTTPKRLLVADTGNHAIRAIDLGTNVVSTLAGTPETFGFFGDGGAATASLLFAPRAITRCGTDLFVADTGNNRVRRITDAGAISTVLGDGAAASSGEGAPATIFSVNSPTNLTCDALGNLYITARSTLRLLAANDSGVVDGSGSVFTIYGKAPRTTYPSNVTSCLSGIAIVDASTLQVTDSCSGYLLELRRAPAL